MLQKDIFIAFFRSGIFGFGGGPSVIPLVHREVVQTFKWMDDDEFSDVLALANALPGPINTKMAGYIGWRVGGTIGMFNALIASIIPTVLLMVLFLTLLTTHKDQPWVAGMAQAVIPVAGVLMGTLTWNFIYSSKGRIGWLRTSILLFMSTIVLQLLRIHPAIFIAALLGTALLSRHKKREPEAKST